MAIGTQERPTITVTTINRTHSSLLYSLLSIYVSYYSQIQVEVCSHSENSKGFVNKHLKCAMEKSYTYVMLCHFQR